MKKNQTKNIAFALLLSLAGGFTLGAALPAVAETAELAKEPAKEFSPEVGKPLQEAQKLLDQKKYPDALAAINGITKTPLTPYESYWVDNTRLSAAVGMGDEKAILDTLPRMIDSSETPKDQRLKLLITGSSLARKHGDNKQALVWLQRYVQEGGTEPSAHDNLVSLYFLNGDYVHAGEEARANIAAIEKAGNAPTEFQLQLLSNIDFKQDDKKNLTITLEKAASYYPNKANWMHVLQNVRPTLPPRLDLDYERLKNYIGLLEARDYAFYADAALHAGYPTEAKKLLDAGYAAKLIDDSTPDVKPLVAQADKDSAAEVRTISQTDAEVRKSKEGLGLVNVGFNYITLGQFDKGLPMMEEGVNAKNLKRPEESKLHLGVAYALAGQKEKAIEAFKTVQGADGTADLARIWSLALAHPMH